MGNTDRQLDNIAQKLDAVGRQVKDVSEKVDKLTIAQQGNADLGAPGLMRRVDELEVKVDGLATQQEVWNTQIRFINWIAGAGGLSGFIALLWTLIQFFNGG